jgi:hypothetical protein
MMAMVVQWLVRKLVNWPDKRTQCKDAGEVFVGGGMAPAFAGAGHIGSKVARPQENPRTAGVVRGRANRPELLHQPTSMSPRLPRRPSSPAAAARAGAAPIVVFLPPPARRLGMTLRVAEPPATPAAEPITIVVVIVVVAAARAGTAPIVVIVVAAARARIAPVVVFLPAPAGGFGMTLGIAEPSATPAAEPITIVVIVAAARAVIAAVAVVIAPAFTASGILHAHAVLLCASLHKG